MILSGKASLADALYAEDAAVRVLGCLGPENTNFDRARATRAGIMVLEPRYGEAASVADDALYLMLSMARERKEGVAIELRNKTLGFLGFPPLAAEIAGRARGFGMELLCYDQDLNRGRAALYHCERTSLVDLFVRSDFVVLLAAPAEWNAALVGNPAHEKGRRAHLSHRSADLSLGRAGEGTGLGLSRIFCHRSAA